MKGIVVYFSQGGNTKRMAEAVYSGMKSAGIQCEISSLKDIDVGRLGGFDLIGLGCPVHRFKAPPNVRVFEESLPNLDGKHSFLFATHAMDRGMVFRDIGEVLLQKGLKVIGHRSWYGEARLPYIPKPYLTDGHPDGIDLKEAADFGKEMVERSLRISQGETGLTVDVLSIKERIYPPEPPVEIKFNKDKCRYPVCRLCVDNCPVEGSIDLSRSPVVLAKEEKCIRCWFCWTLCPNGAIEINWEPFAKDFKEVELPGALQMMERAQARGYFRRLVDMATINVEAPWYKSCDRPATRMDASPCMLACPIHMDIPGYLGLAGEGQLQEAYRLLTNTNPLPAVCGRVCYHPCEDVCKRHHVDEPLAIAALKRYIADQVDFKGVERSQISKKGKKVAIVGGGPCGLAATHDLALLGYEVTMFESLPVLGGMMRVGIPEYRLPREELRKDIEEILKLGIEVRLNAPIGSAQTLKELKQQGYEALLLATGAHLSRPLNIQGVGFDGVFQGVYLLKDKALGRIPGNLFEGKKVVVVGGGNVAIDAARTAVRLGAKELQLACLETKEQMPAHPWEIQCALVEGVVLNCSWGPKRILGEDNRVSGIEFTRCTSVFDKEGRFNPSYDETSRMSLQADAVIIAIGQAPDTSLANETIGVQVTKQGTIKADEITHETNADGIFAAGEVVAGRATVIEAIAAGKRAARSIDNYLRGIPLAAGQIEERKVREVSEEECKRLQKLVAIENRVRMKELPPTERIKSFAEVELGLDLAQSKLEAKRCLRCEGKLV